MFILINKYKMVLMYNILYMCQCKQYSCVFIHYYYIGFRLSSGAPRPSTVPRERLIQRWIHVDLTLAHCLRRRPTLLKPTLIKLLVSAGRSLQWDKLWPNLSRERSRNHYTYLYRRNLWLKPLVSDTVWATQFFLNIPLNVYFVTF